MGRLEQPSTISLITRHRRLHDDAQHNCIQSANRLGNPAIHEAAEALIILSIVSMLPAPSLRMVSREAQRRPWKECTGRGYRGSVRLVDAGIAVGHTSDHRASYGRTASGSRSV